MLIDWLYIVIFQLLWTKELRMNTVHVSDVCCAIWHLTEHGETRSVYNLADKGDMSELPLLSNNITVTIGQGKITSLISQIFNMNYDYFGTVLSNLAKVSS